MTLDETADFISQELPEWQRDMNLQFLMRIHVKLTDGGVWCYPAAGLMFTKNPEGFELMLDD